MDKNKTILKHMLDEIEYLQNYAAGLSLESFLNSEDRKRVVSMTLINIGELVRHFSKDFRKQNSDIPFDKVLGLRDITAHGYKTLKFERIWNLFEHDIPDLKSKITKLLDTKVQ